MATFVRTDEYEAKLFSEALFDDKRVHKDAEIIIQHENGYSGKLKCYCPTSDTYLQFPRKLRQYDGQKYIADVVEVIREDGCQKYYRAMPKSIRNTNSDEVLA